jgi:hypothetical protein
MKTVNYQNMKTQLSEFLHKAGKIASYAIVGGACILGGYYYSKIKNAPEAVKPTMQIQPAVKMRDVSIAINERNERIIIDRNSGEYMTYQDSVGMAVFSLYAGKIYTSKTAQ